MRESLKRLLAFRQWPLFYKAFVSILVMVWGTLLLFYFVSRFSAQRHIGGQIRDNFASLSVQQMGKIAAVLEHQVDSVHMVALDEDVVERLLVSDARYSRDPSIELADLERAWQAASPNDPLVRAVTGPDENALTAQLLAYMEGFPEYTSILITDRYGGLLAATSRPSNYAYAEEVWWQETYREGSGSPHVITLDTSTGVEVLAAYPVYDRDGETLIGIVRALFNLEDIQQLLDNLSFVAQAGVVLVDDDHNILATGQEAPSDDFDPAWLGSSAYRSQNAWQEVQLEDGQLLLVGYSFIDKVVPVSAPDKRAVHDLQWALIVFTSPHELYSPLLGTGRSVILWGIVLCIVLTSLGYWGARKLILPLSQLVAVVTQESQGDRNARAWVYTPDDVGVLAQHINRLLEEKSDLLRGVEQRATEREYERTRRQRELEVTSAVGMVASATLEIHDLISQVVELIRERLGLYFVGIFLLNESRTRAVLQGGSGEIGHSLLARGHRLLLEEGEVGRCIVNGKAVLNTDIGRSDATTLPDFPYARSELALPLRSRGMMLGALSVYSYHADTFDDDLMMILQTIADQIAVAIDSIRLFNAQQESARSLQLAYGEASREAWESLLQTSGRVGAGYRSERVGSNRLLPAEPEDWPSEALQAWREGHMVAAEPDISGEDTVQEHYLALPIVVRGVVIGVIDVSRPRSEGMWTADEISELETLTYQLGVALENARLYEDARSRALRQRMLSDVSGRIRSPMTVDAVLQTTVREMRELLGLEEAEIRLDERFGVRTGTSRLPNSSKDQA